MESVLAALITALGAVAVSVIGVRVANRLGLGPVQGQYVTILRELNAAKDERIRQLEAEKDDDRERIEHLEQRVEDLETTVFNLRQQLARRRGSSA